MPDFNKGDFTQQGVNGHVNATVRLNEKRLVNIDMTSNEEAEGCTITGNVTDLLNDKVYNIGSGGGGGGGEGYLPLCTANIINNTAYRFTNQGGYRVYGNGLSDEIDEIDANSTVTRQCAYTYINAEEHIYFAGFEFSNLEVDTPIIEYTNLVNCTVDLEHNVLLITDETKPSSATLTLTVKQ